MCGIPAFLIADGELVTRDGGGEGEEKEERERERRGRSHRKKKSLEIRVLSGFGLTSLLGLTGSHLGQQTH